MRSPYKINTITPAVYLTSEYSASPQAKAAELTKLIQNLFSAGVWDSAQEAAENGIPTGTFIVVNNPDTPVEDFKVEIVPFYRRVL